MKPDFGHWRRVALQLAIDLAPPAIIAALLTGISAYNNPAGLGWIKVAGSYFTTLFFVAAYFGFVQRADKKVKDRANHASVIEKQGAALTRLEELSSSLQGIATQLVAVPAEIASVGTGGDGFCYLDYLRLDEGKATFIIKMQGKYPIHEVVFRITSYENFAARAALANQQKRPAIALEGDYEGELGMFTPTVVRNYMAPELRLPTDQRVIRMHIHWTARNGFWYQKYHLVGGLDREYLSATQVTRIGSPEPLYERADPGFPRDAQGRPLFTEEVSIRA